MNKLLQLIQDQERDDYVTKEVEDVYNAIAEKTGRTPEEIAKIGGIESEHDKYSKNMAGSRAKGLFQLMPQTVKDLSSNGSPESLNTQEEVMTRLLQENQKKLGQDSSIEDLYLLHNQGLGKGRKLIAASEDEPVGSILSKQIINSNPALYKNKTVGEAKESIKEMLDQKGGNFKFRTKLEDLFTKDQIPESAGTPENPNAKLIDESNVLNDLVQYLVGMRDDNIEKKEQLKKAEEQNKFFEQLMKLKKERAEKVKKKYGGEI
jgi:hypothetical protein